MALTPVCLTWVWIGRSKLGCACLLEPVGTIDVKCEMPLVVLQILIYPSPSVPPTKGQGAEAKCLHTFGVWERWLIWTEVD